MKPKRLIPILALCLLLTGCGWMNGSYASVKAHQEQHQENSLETMTASNYLDLMEALEQLIAEGAETGIINIADFPTSAAKRGMEFAISHAMGTYAIGAYAVSGIDYELGTNNGIPSMAVSVTYRHNAAQIRAIQHLSSIAEAQDAIAQALESYEPEVVLLVEAYSDSDFTQIVRTYAEAHPDTVMEIPQVTANIYGTSVEKVIELSFSFQNSRNDLRKMQSQTQKVFDSAVLYVSGDGEDHQKFTQLYAFLMERFPYTIETSITPAYSLLRHGVGDSRAFATVFAAMCREAGLEAITVTGTCSGEPRTWNIISDNGHYYHLDLLKCYAEGGFREMTDGEMTSYVWDYSAYPPCPDLPSTEYIPSEPQPTQSTLPRETTPEPTTAEVTEETTIPETSEPPTQPLPTTAETENFEDF